uniref:hypothetical protein n=1 Tax=Acetatifactor sp. TaxID=1872090 RepID=UPI0040578AE9
MMNRKNAFSYIMWFVYSMAVCVSLFAIAANLSVQAGFSEAVGYGVGAVWLVLGGLIVFLVHKLVGNLVDGKEFNKLPAMIAEALIAVILVVVGIFLRVKGLSIAGDDATYYELAKVAEGQSIPIVVHGASYIYLQLLHFVYFLFGNKFVAGIWLQICLQMIAALCLYAAVRKKVGVIAATIVLGFMTVGPSMVEETLSLSPEMFLLAVFCLVLYFAIRCICGTKGSIMSLITGLCISVVCYLDISGVCLLFFSVVGLLQEVGDEERSLSGRLLSSLLCIVGSVVGFLFFMLLDALVSGKAFASVIMAWWNLYVPTTFSIPNDLKLSSVGVDVLLLLLLMAWGIFGYWISFFKERQSAWIWLACLLVLLQCFGMTTAETNGYLLVYIVFAILSGISITNMLGLGDEEDEMKPLDRMIRKEEKTVMVSGRGRVVEESPVSGRDRVNVQESVAKDEESKEEKTKVKYLDNPLPLPKKHVKKTLDYDYDVAVEQDDYDFVVDDNDDYDI